MESFFSAPAEKARAARQHTLSLLLLMSEASLFWREIMHNDRNDGDF